MVLRRGCFRSHRGKEKGKSARVYRWRAERGSPTLSLLAGRVEIGPVTQTGREKRPREDESKMPVGPRPEGFAGVGGWAGQFVGGTVGGDV